MKSICFVTNYKKTFFFEEIAKKLKKNDTPVYWIVLNKMLYDFLISEGYKEHQLLLINKSACDVTNKEVGEYKLNELICKDRALKYYKNWSYQYLTNIQKPILDFLKVNDIRFVFGETTYGHEILISRIINDDNHSLNCVYLNPMNVRIPTGRFTFLSDEFQSTIYNRINIPLTEPIKEVSIERPLESVKVQKLVSSSLKLSSKIKRLGRFFSLINLEKDDPSISPTDFIARLKKGTREELNRITYFFVKRHSSDVLANKNFVIYTLHKQPEASIDVVGRYYDDQYQNIFNIWRFIPESWYIVVKEHNNAIGDRGYAFFRKLSKLKNLILIHENENSHDLIKKAQAIFSISGSIAYEAAILGKPAFLMSDIFFDLHPNCYRITLEDFRKTKNIEDLIEAKKNEKKVLNFTEYLYSRSFPGLISDPLTNPDCMKSENIDVVAKAFLDVISLN